jgi:FMN phosphatase YigB (HAD superfamily)
MIIISNGSFEQQCKKLKRTGVADKFSVIVTSEEAGVSKPNIEILYSFTG